MVLACSLAKISPAASIEWLERNKRFKYCAPTYMTSYAALYVRRGNRPQTLAIERFHVTSQSRENHTGGHFGVQLNRDLVCCMMRVQNAAQNWQLMDLPHKYVRYRYPVHVICETWAHWLHSSRLSHTSSYLLVHQDGRHAQKYYGVMQTYIIFSHVMKTLYSNPYMEFCRWYTCLTPLQRVGLAQLII